MSVGYDDLFRVSSDMWGLASELHTEVQDDDDKNEMHVGYMWHDAGNRHEDRRV